MLSFRIFAVASAALAFLLAILGSWVRINDAGMTCPDWPLCRGSLVPLLSGGVVLEWSHRTTALAESFLLLGAIVTGSRVRREIIGVTPTLVALAALFIVQVILGGATVHLANSPISVMLHWGAAMALLAVLTTLAVLAILAPRHTPHRASATTPWDISSSSVLAVAVVLGFIAMCVGSYVSSSYAGLACSTFPDCQGSLLGRDFAQNMQMLHRITAAAFTIMAFIATLYSVRVGSPHVKYFALTGITLLLTQLALGAFNVVSHLPTILREAHAANACLTFLAFVIATVTAAVE
jgi:heme A synthase